jgi:hypothetical protein
MDIWVIIITAALGFVSAMLVYMLQQKMKENKELKDKQEREKTQHEKAMEDGVVCILRKHLMDEHETWTARGYITAKALESGLLMYKAYKGLGGNGMIDHMEEEIQELPIRD